MRDRDYYPAGAYDDPSAPFNEPSIPDREFEVTISQTLSKIVTVTTDDYILTGDVDEEGNYGTWYDTSETDWNKVYNEQHFKIQDLLHELKQYVLEDMKNTGKNTGKGMYLKRLLEACDGWTEDECEVIEE